MVKIAGATMPLFTAVLLVTWWSYREEGLPPYALALILVTVVATVIVHLGLVAFALQPLSQLGETLDAFSRGDERAEVKPSQWSDANVAHLEQCVARLLAGVRRDRARARALAASVLRQNEAEQGRFARELFDSTAQSMAALLFELRALAATVDDPALRQRLEGVREIASGVLDEVTGISQQAQMGWSSHHGMHTALEHLVREHNEQASACLKVRAPAGLDALDITTAGVLYRATQAALRLAALERSPSVTLVLGIDHGRAVLDVQDDASRAAIRPSDPESFEPLRARAELLGGSFESHRDGGRRLLRLDLPAAPPRDGDGASLSEESP